MDPSDESSVDKLQRRLYARGDAPKQRPRRELHEDAHQVQEGWVTQEDLRHEQEHDQEKLTVETYLEELGVPKDTTPSILKDRRAMKDAVIASRKQRTTSRVVRSIFVVSLAFFLVSAGVAGYFFFFGRNQISCDNIAIDVTGPLSIPSGKELILNVGILNKNPSPMQLTELAVKYPDGTKSAEDSTLSLPTARERIGTIDAGERVRTSTHALLFGKEQDEHTIDLTVEYRVDESNAVFECSAPYKVVIATAPVGLAVDGLSEVASGQELALEVKVTSNSDKTVPNQRLVAEYPFGFEFVRAEPDPSNGHDAWDLGDVAPGAERVIKVYGVVNAPTVESRSVKFKVGEKDGSGSNALASVVQLVEHAFYITQAFLDLKLLINDEGDPEVPVNSGGVINANLLYKNTLPYAIYDVEIEAKLDSPIVREESIIVNQGYYRSLDQTVLWTGQTSYALKSIQPGEAKSLTFSFGTQALTQGTGVLKPSMDIDFIVRARRTSDDAGVQQKLVAQSKRKIKFITSVDFTEEYLYALGPFTNTGAHPPVPNHETTYTVKWTIRNTTSQLEDVQVQAELPIYMRWLDTTSPSDGSINYNPTSHMITWNAGTVPPGTGSRLPAREMYIQVAIIPSVTDDYLTFPLVRGTRFSGVDQFTGSVIEKEELMPLRLRDDVDTQE